MWKASGARRREMPSSSSTGIWKIFRNSIGDKDKQKEKQRYKGLPGASCKHCGHEGKAGLAGPGQGVGFLQGHASPQAAAGGGPPRAVLLSYEVRSLPLPPGPALQCWAVSRSRGPSVRCGAVSTRPQAGRVRRGAASLGCCFCLPTYELLPL